MGTSYLDYTLAEFTGAVAARQPSPGGGSVAAMTVAAAAGLVAMAARYSDGRLDDAEALAGRADTLRERAGRLADADAEAYGAVLAAYATPRDGDAPGRAERIKKALRRAAEVPLEVAGVAAEVAGMAARLVREGNPNLVGDARTAALLAEAAARSAAGLVRLNAELGDLGAEVVAEAGRLADAAGEAARRAGPPGPAAR